MKLPPLPAQVHSALGSIPVLIVANLKDEDGKDVFGLYDAFARIIRVREGMHPAVMWSTYYHELTHAEIGDIGVALTLDQEEAVCNAIANARVSELLASLPSKARR